MRFLSGCASGKFQKPFVVLVLGAILFGYMTARVSYLVPNKSRCTGSGLVERRLRSELASVLGTYERRMSNTQRPILNPHAFDYVLNSPGVCKGNQVETVIAVPSRIHSFEARRAVRETWGRVANNTVLLFFFGIVQSREGSTISGIRKNTSEKTPGANDLQTLLVEESNLYGDIVQENFIDSYRNLSLKSVAIVRWVSLYCPGSTFVIKADDDMYINMAYMTVSLRAKLRETPIFIMGMVNKDKTPHRDPNHKWFVPENQFNESVYPDYVSGTAYSMTTTAALRLYVESFYVRPIYMEDAYLTGILARNVGVPRLHHPLFFGHRKLNATGCFFRDKISGHENSPEEIRKIHRELLDSNLKC